MTIILQIIWKFSVDFFMILNALCPESTRFHDGGRGRWFSSTAVQTISKLDYRFTPRSRETRLDTTMIGNYNYVMKLLIW